MDPRRLRADRYDYFVTLLRRNLAYGGALRLDHVMGLFRLFWIPRGLPPSAGAYVAYPSEDLLGILALESVRHQALIVGEDLGTVPDMVRTRLGEAGVLSYRVLYFERRSDGDWNDPSWYPDQSVAVATTHDLPTLSGFWALRDHEIRSERGHYADAGARSADEEGRRKEKTQLLEALRGQGLAPADAAGQATDESMPPALRRAVYAFLAKARSWIVLLTLEDLVGDVEQVNVPGTLDQFPNWLRKCRATLPSLRNSRETVEWARVFHRAGRGRGPRLSDD
jgi:4-alpha-glucanotransferase